MGMASHLHLTQLFREDVGPDARRSRKTSRVSRQKIRHRSRDSMWFLLLTGYLSPCLWRLEVERLNEGLLP